MTFTIPADTLARQRQFEATMRVIAPTMLNKSGSNNEITVSGPMRVESRLSSSAKAVEGLLDSDVVKPKDSN